jgi:hypothetical protein
VRYRTARNFGSNVKRSSEPAFFKQEERERERENIILSIYRFRRGPGARERLLGTVIRERGLGMFMPAVLGPVATIESWSVVRDPPVRVIEPDLNCIIASYNFT